MPHESDSVYELRALAPRRRRRRRSTMQSTSRVTLRIPDPEDFDEETYAYIPVPSGVVDSGIDLLQCVLGQWKKEVGCQSDEQVWDPLMVCAAQMLAGLLGAWTEYYDGNRARLLVQQIAWFCRPRSTEGPQDLEAVRTAENADIIDALIALHQARQKTHKEQQPGAEEQGPVAQRDPGWEF
jgi:hypothetical protein